jgi:hypothetical protein
MLAVMDRKSVLPAWRRVQVPLGDRPSETLLAKLDEQFAAGAKLERRR